MEATAKYHRLPHRSLHAAGLAVAIVNPLRSRLFAEAIGQLAKTDRLDARVLAMMAESLEPKATAPTPEDLEAMQEIVRARQAAVADQTALSNQRLASQTAFLKAELSRRLKTLAASIARLDVEINRRLQADPALRRRYDILISIPGIGPVAAIAIIAGLPELGACSGKAASLLAGLAPLACESGEKAGDRRIKGGRGHVRKGLYFAALTAARFNPQLAAVYKRLRAAGKKPKVAITAIMRKLVVLANVLIRQDRPWTPIHA
jgi:transposase